jgi:nitrite reductase/ring-hydroxylating ferredoxin subunit/uncharacterized membrane protein
MAVGAKLRSATHLFDGRGMHIRPVGRETIGEQIEGLTALDPVAGWVQKLVRRAIPPGSALKDLLSGTWLGHPLHPPLTDLVIGSWLSSWLLDKAGSENDRTASELLLGAGIFAGVPTVASGLSDAAELRGGTRRVALVHALGNTTALTLEVLSLRARRRGDHERGVALSTVAITVAGGSAWLGGHLAFGRGVGVNETAFDEFPESWTPLVSEAELETDKPVRRSANDVGIMLVRHDGRIHAIADRCSHRGCSLADGTIRDDTIVCWCHGSTFTLEGDVVRGPATFPQPSLEVRVQDGQVEVRRSPEPG